MDYFYILKRGLYQLEVDFVALGQRLVLGSFDMRQLATLFRAMEVFCRPTTFNCL
jgi:hypothetical protein